MPATGGELKLVPTMMRKLSVQVGAFGPWGPVSVAGGGGVPVLVAVLSPDRWLLWLAAPRCALSGPCLAAIGGARPVMGGGIGVACSLSDLTCGGRLGFLCSP